MKKVLLILVVAVTVLTSCKKDPEDKLKGRWDLTKDYYVETLNGTITDEDTDTYAIGDLYLVFDGNTVKTYKNGDLQETSTYTATNNSITVDGETYALRWNSKSEFVLVEEGTDTYGGQTYNYKNESTFKKN